MRNLRNIQFLIFILLFISLGHSLSYKELISSYNFDRIYDVELLQNSDRMIDRDGNGINDTLIIDMVVNTTLVDNTVVLELVYDDGIITEEKSISASERFNFSFGTLFLSQERLNYTFKIYDDNYNLRLRKGNIETNAYNNYDELLTIMNITDEKTKDGIIIKLFVNSTLVEESNLTLYLTYNSSIIQLEQHTTLVNGIQEIDFIVDNERIKQTHLVGTFNLTSLRIGNRIKKLDKLTSNYDYQEFAQGSYIRDVFDKQQNGSLSIEFELNINESGIYGIQYSVSDIHSELIDIKNESYNLEQGGYNVSSITNGTKIYMKRLDGPYEIKGISLSKDGVIVDFLNAYMTAYYQYTEFQIPPLPDLIVNITKVEDENITITIFNLGNLSAFNIFTEIFMYGTSLNRYQVTFLREKEGINYTLELSNITEGELIAIVDIDNYVEELDELNNGGSYLIDINYKPVLVPIENLTYKVKDLIIINLSAHDSDNDAIIYSINDSRFIQIDNQFLWQPIRRDIGVHTILASATDGFLNDTITIYITITKDNVNLSCKPKWICSNWSECISGYKVRECSDIKNCGNNFGRPKSIRRCNVLNETDTINKNSLNSENYVDIFLGIIIVLMLIGIFTYLQVAETYQIIIFLMLIVIPIGISDWVTYQHDIMNTGKADGNGNFPKPTYNLTVNFGMNYQPLVDDIDNDGKNEVVIFSKGQLIITDALLNVIDNTSIGTLLGEATLVDYNKDGLMEIIFNARQKNNHQDYFFVYSYNNGLRQEFNITMINNLNGSGIKCFGVNDTVRCIFIDSNNSIHTINMDTQMDEVYNLNTTGDELIQRIPAIADVDNDGRNEAVFWYDNNTDLQYGFLVYDIEQKNVEVVVDNIYLANNLDIILRGYLLKGQPVLVDINNDDKYEIAMSVFYDDIQNYEAMTDMWTELFVYSNNGTKLFSVCEKGFAGCHDGSSIISRWEGTNPFVLDIDDNGIDEICFIKDDKNLGYFQAMVLNCYDYNGKELININITQELRVSSAITADMDNDGRREVITDLGIYTPKGDLIASHNLRDVAPIVADLDSNSGLDLLWSYRNVTKALLDNVSYSNDVFVSVDEIRFYVYNDTYVNVSLVIRNIGDLFLENVDVVMYNTKTLENSTSKLDIISNGNATFSSLIRLENEESIFVKADYEDRIKESDEGNNFVTKEFFGLPYVFVSVELLPFSVMQIMKDYISAKLSVGYYTDDESLADVKVYIGKNNFVNQFVLNPSMLRDGIGYGFGEVVYYDKKGTLPYNAVIGGLNDDGVKVMIAGNEIEGTIAGVKEFVDKQTDFILTANPQSLFVDEQNIEAIKVYDFMHNSANQENYMKDNLAFRNVVRNSLYGEFFSESDKSVTTNDGIELRLRNYKPVFSSALIEFINSSGVPVDLPVVLGAGLWGNLSSFQTLGGELANTGRDTWLVEITGGPGQDCVECIDYTFEDMTDRFVPALLNGVLEFTGGDRLQYVGHSNGCRSVLSSLEKNAFDTSKVESFVGVGCPGAFEEISLFGGIIDIINTDESIKTLENSGRGHFSLKEAVTSRLLKPSASSEGENLISLNLLKQYVDWINQNNDLQPGINVSLDNFAIIQGTAFLNSDGIVTTYDEDSIYMNIKLNEPQINTTNTKSYYSIIAGHIKMGPIIGLMDSKNVKSLIVKILNKKDLDFYQRNFELKKSESKST